VWLGLSGITLISWWIGSQHDHDAARLNAVVTLSVLLIAVIKVRVIMREFMEVRHAPRLLRRFTDAWLVLLFVVLIAIYVIGMRIYV
jgi:apolipoprotein N-acyltransferase